MTRLLRSTALATALLAGSALAGNTQTHECVKDGQPLQKTKKECHKAGGQWQKLTAAKSAPEVKPSEPKAAEPTPAPAPEAEPAAK